jgi:hypothetical protein
VAGTLRQVSGHPAVVRTYPNDVSAEMARIALESRGILAFVQSQTAAGLFRAANGVQVVVRRDHLQAARQILDALDGNVSIQE